MTRSILFSESNHSHFLLGNHEKAEPASKGKASYHSHLPTREPVEAKASPSIPLNLRIGTSIKKFFTERLSQFFHGIALSFKSGAEKEQLQRKIAAAKFSINDALKSRKAEEEYPLLSYDDDSFMQEINKKHNTTLSGMEMARLLDINKKVEERIEAYAFIKKVSQDPDSLRISSTSENYQFIFKLLVKLTGEADCPPRPLGESERNKLLKLIPAFSKNKDDEDELFDPISEDMLIDPAEIDFADLSEKLLVPIETLKKKERQAPASFARYVQKKTHRYSAVIAQAKADYAQISVLYQESKDGQRKLVPKDGAADGEVSPELTPEILMKIIRKANLSLYRKDEKEDGAAITMKTGPKDNRTWRQFLTNRTAEGLQVIQWSDKILLNENDPSYLGEGSFGTVQKVYDISHATIKALKLAKQDADPVYAAKATEDIVNEGAKLTAFDSTSDGLQHRPIAAIGIPFDHEGKKIYGYWGNYYNERSLQHAIDIQNFHDLPFNSRERLLMILPLFLGLKILQTPTKTRGPVIHGDIKPGNVFMQKKDGKYSLFIGDLGDAKDLQNELPLSKRPGLRPLGTVSTPGYYTKTDLQRLRETNSQEDWVKYQLKRDNFALASSAWELLIGSEVYEIDSTKGINKNTALTSKGITPSDLTLFKYLYGESLAKLFELTLDEDPDKRPSIDEMIAGISEAIGKQNPDDTPYPLN